MLLQPKVVMLLGGEGRITIPQGNRLRCCLNGAEQSRLMACTNTLVSHLLSDSVRSRIVVTHVEWWSKRMEYATRGGFCGFGPQNPDGSSKAERTTRGGIEEFASS